MKIFIKNVRYLLKILFKADLEKKSNDSLKVLFRLEDYPLEHPLK
jgi:hypothetical protein